VGEWAPVLQLVGDKNLQLLTKRSDVEIIKPILSQENINNVTRNAVSWKLYLEYATKARQEDSGSTFLKIDGVAPINLVELFLWASKNAFNFVEVSGDAIEFENVIWKDLLCVTKKLEEDLLNFQNTAVEASHPVEPCICTIITSNSKTSS